MFVRMLLGCTAWDHAAAHLVKRSFLRTPQPIVLHMVDLPHNPNSNPKPADVDAMVKAWDFSPSEFTEIEEPLTLTRRRPSRGACHCEAGIMATILAAATSSILAPSDIVTPLFSDSNIKKVFEKIVNSVCSLLLASALTLIYHVQLAPGVCIILSTFGTNISEYCLQEPISIGVGKKPCPCCTILAEVLCEKYSIKIEMPGAHSTFFPWLPPAWLPDEVLEAMEKKMLDLVKKFATAPIPSSTSTSPASSYSDTNPLKKPDNNSIRTRFMLEK